MSDACFLATLPRGPTLRRGRSVPNGIVVMGGGSNKGDPSGGLHSPPVVCLAPSGSERSVHDGFATIRSSKRGRARSSPSVGCPPCPTCGSVAAGSGGRNGGGNQKGSGRGLEPLWEEKGAGTEGVTKREKNLPWWEVATRRSRYRSCPAFSQASMVSALEQTVTSVSDRLERLASSPDLKAPDVAELRQTAQVLRQQSSAVCHSISSGLYSLERHHSCDSVSSMTSNVSGVSSLNSFVSLASRYSAPPPPPMPDPLDTPEDTKVKKRSWLRNSFRRAFGRSGRHKRSKSSPMSAQHAGRAKSVEELELDLSPLPPPPTPQCSQPPNRTFSPSHNIFTKKLSASEQEELVRLRLEGGEKERALTELRLENLNLQHQIQGLNDALSQQKAEATTHREEITRLGNLVRSQYGSTADSLLSNTLTSLSLTHPAGSGVSSSGRRVRLMLASSNLGGVAEARNVQLEQVEAMHVASLNVESRATWETLDGLVMQALQDYASLVDPVSSLGLTSGSALCYRVDEAVRARDTAAPDLLPCGYIVGEVDKLFLWLKGPQQRPDGGGDIGCVEQLAAESLIPTPALQRYVALLHQHRRLVLAGPAGTGKTHLARLLARHLALTSGRSPDDGSVCHFTVTATNTLEFCQLISSLWPRSLAGGRSTASSVASSNSPASSAPQSPSTGNNATSSATSSSPPASAPLVLVLDCLEAAAGVVETLQRCLPSSASVGPAILATTRASQPLTSKLQIHCNFRWIGLSVGQEPVRGLVGRVLRRAAIRAHLQQETAAGTPVGGSPGQRLHEALSVADWLHRLWLHVNSLLANHGNSETSLDLGVMLDCPGALEQGQAWFSEVWNYRIAPHLTEAVRNSNTGSVNLSNSWTDPVEWILATYPWPPHPSAGPDSLARISACELGLSDGGSLNGSPRKSSPGSRVGRVEAVYATPRATPVALKQNSNVVGYSRPPEDTSHYAGHHSPRYAGNVVTSIVDNLPPLYNGGAAGTATTVAEVHKSVEAPESSSIFTNGGAVTPMETDDVVDSVPQSASRSHFPTTSLIGSSSKIPIYSSLVAKAASTRANQQKQITQSASSLIQPTRVTSSQNPPMSHIPQVSNNLPPPPTTKQSSELTNGGSNQPPFSFQPPSLGTTVPIYASTNGLIKPRPEPVGTLGTFHTFSAPPVENVSPNEYAGAKLLNGFSHDESENERSSSNRDSGALTEEDEEMTSSGSTSSSSTNSVIINTKSSIPTLDHRTRTDILKLAAANDSEDKKRTFVSEEDRKINTLNKLDSRIGLGNGKLNGDLIPTRSDVKKPLSVEIPDRNVNGLSRASVETAF